jgi:hypothetical protein
MISSGLLKSSLLLLLFFAFSPGQPPSPAGHTFELVSVINGVKEPENYIRFSEAEFTTTVGIDSNGARTKIVAMGRWVQKNDTIFLEYDAGNIDTATISLLKVDTASVVMLDINGRLYDRIR